ncbi:MAG: hypothetical protein QOD64_1242, partial [Verrucomicrobiota bacterium]
MSKRLFRFISGLEVILGLFLFAG